MDFFSRYAGITDNLYLGYNIASLSLILDKAGNGVQDQFNNWKVLKYSKVPKDWGYGEEGGVMGCRVWAEFLRETTLTTRYSYFGWGGVWGSP